LTLPFLRQKSIFSKKCVGAKLVRRINLLGSGCNVPIVGISEDTLSARTLFFQDRIDAQLKSAALKNIGLVYHTKIPDILSHVYFGLSQSYKRIYIREGNKTDTPKRAAITCAAIAAVQPLRPPLVVNDVDKEEYIYANPMFAIRCSSSIVGHPNARTTTGDEHIEGSSGYLFQVFFQYYRKQKHIMAT
jgi:hypothetical protein